MKRPRPYPWLGGQTYPASANLMSPDIAGKIFQFKLLYAYDNDIDYNELESVLAAYGGVTDVSDTDSNDSDY